jgi:hypothetical protein
MTDHEDERGFPKDDASQHGDGRLSRREIVTVGLAAVGAGLSPSAAAAATEQAAASVGVGASGTTTTEFRARFEQSGPTGEHFIAYGYITSARGLSEADLFAGTPLSDTSALLTAYAEGELVRRTVDQSVHSLDIEGTLTVYQRASPGATFSDAGSFQVGTPVAQFAITLQDIVTVFAPAKGLPTLTGDMRQTSASHLEGTGLRKKFGSVGAESRLFATGLGTLLNPATFNSFLEMAGHWTMK